MQTSTQADIILRFGWAWNCSVIEGYEDIRLCETATTDSGNGAGTYDLRALHGGLRRRSAPDLARVLSYYLVRFHFRAADEFLNVWVFRLNEFFICAAKDDPALVQHQNLCVAKTEVICF